MLWAELAGLICVALQMGLGRMKWAWHMTRVGEKRTAARSLKRKTEGNRRLERCRRGWEGNIEMDLKADFESVLWILLVRNTDERWAVVRTVMNLRVS